MVISWSKTFFLGSRRRHSPLKRRWVFMHDNAPFHAAKSTSDIRVTVSFKCEKLMTWPACSPDLNPIENMLAMLKRRIYESGFRQKKSCGPQYFSVQTILLQVRSKNWPVLWTGHGGYICKWTICLFRSLIFLYIIVNNLFPLIIRFAASIPLRAWHEKILWKNKTSCNV